jgi:hypothetical protein
MEGVYLDPNGVLWSVWVISALSPKATSLREIGDARCHLSQSEMVVGQLHEPNLLAQIRSGDPDARRY